MRNPHHRQTCLHAVWGGVSLVSLMSLVIVDVVDVSPDKPTVATVVFTPPPRKGVDFKSSPFLYSSTGAVSQGSHLKCDPCQRKEFGSLRFEIKVRKRKGREHHRPRPLGYFSSVFGLYFSSPVSIQRRKSLIFFSLHPSARKPRRSRATSCMFTPIHLLPVVLRGRYHVPSSQISHG